MCKADSKIFETQSLEARIIELLAANFTVVLVTIIQSEGSAPRHAGTRAILSPKGFEGTIGGGILEAQAMDLAKEALETKSSRLAYFSLKATADSDMVCGGNIEVLCEVLDKGGIESFNKALAAEVKGQRGQWVVDISKGSLNQVNLVRKFYLDTEISDLTKYPKLVATAKGKRYLEPLNPLPILLLCGGGHVALEVGKLAHNCDFIVDVVDDRQEFSNKLRFPFARNCYVCPNYADIREVCKVGPGHYVAIMTRGHAFDSEVLAQILAGSAKYIGMIGSKTKRDQVYAKLKNQGVSEKLLAKVCCPIGLSLACETPQQIAVSIVAELLAAKAQVLGALRPTP